MSCIRKVALLRLRMPFIGGRVPFGSDVVGSHCAGLSCSTRRFCRPGMLSATKSNAIDLLKNENWCAGLVNVRGFADEPEKTSGSLKEKSGQKRPDKSTTVNEDLQHTFEEAPTEERGDKGSGQKKNQSDRGQINFALRVKTPKTSKREAVSGRPDPIRMQKSVSREEASTDAGGYLKLEDIGYSEKEANEILAKEQSVDHRIKDYNPKDSGRRNELPYDLLKNVKKEEKGKGEQEGKSESKEGPTKGDKDPEDTLEKGKKKQDEDVSDDRDDPRGNKKGKSQMKKKDDDEDDLRDKKRSTKKSDDDDDDDRDEKPSERQKSSSKGADDSEDSGNRNDRRSPKRSTQQSVERSTSGAQASSDAAGVGQLTEQLMDRDEADKRADQKDFSEGEKWKEGAREEGIEVHDDKADGESKKRPRS